MSAALVFWPGADSGGLPDRVSPKVALAAIESQPHQPAAKYPPDADL